MLKIIFLPLLFVFVLLIWPLASGVMTIVITRDIS